MNNPTMHRTELAVFQTNPLKLQCPAEKTSLAVKTPQPFKITLRDAVLSEFRAVPGL
jgi:hypothetical protein